MDGKWWLFAVAAAAAAAATQTNDNKFFIAQQSTDVTEAMLHTHIRHQPTYIYIHTPISSCGLTISA